MRSRTWSVALMLPACALGLLAACGAFSGDDGAPEPPAVEAGPLPEAAAADTSLDTADAAPPKSFCAVRTDKPILCADFDDVPIPRIYEEGTAADIMTSADRTVTTPGFSAPNALWMNGRLSSTTSPAPLTAIASATATHVVADLDVFVEESDAAVIDGALVRVGIQPSQCYVDLVLQTASLIVQTHCVYTDDAADYYDYKTVLNNRLASSKWTHVTLDVDYSKFQATVSIDGTPKGPPLGLNPAAKPGGTPRVDVGIGLKGVRVGFDDILVAAVPP